jgi:hypothetical protein
MDVRVVRPNPDGGWSVVVPGARRASSQHRQRYDAIAVARRTLQNNGGGTVEVVDEAGDAVERQTVLPVRNRRVGDLKLH